jgi:Kef-type K+ transport system membrane component KefB
MRDNVLLLIMPVFFLSTGLRTNWQMGGEVVVAVALLMFVAQFVSKYTGIWIAGKILNWQPGEVKLIAWLLQTKALIEIIFVNVLLDKGIITSEMFTAMLLMAILSTMATIPMVTKLKKQYPQLT